VACVAVMVAAVGFARIIDRHPAHTIPIPRSGVLPTIPLTARPGRNLITVHGLTISVPDSWPQMIGHPCIIRTDLVMLPASSTLDCVPGRLKNVSTVTFFEPQLGTSLVAGPSTAIRIDGIAATRTSFSDIVAKYVVIEVPSLRVSVQIGTPTAAEAEQLVATLQIASADVHGCPSVTPSEYDLTALHRADRADADRLLLPAGASTMTLCRYQDGWLEQGATVPPSQLASFTASMNALPAGLSRASDDQEKACHSTTNDSKNLNGQSAQDSAGYLVRAGYRSGPAVTVVVRLGRCGDLGASNGTRTAQRTSELITLVTTLVGDAQGYPLQVVPA
jgi:hypothetical protein